MAGRAELVSIQHLRAIAALMVIVYHSMRWTPVDFDVGAAGVDLFFIISGFIMWTIAAERPTTPIAFLTRRWIRIAPLYWLLTLAVAAVSLIWPTLIWDAKPTGEHVLLSLLFIQHLNPDGQPFPVVTPGWSLNYEVLFYLIFAACLLAPARLRLRVLTAALIAVPAFGIIVTPTYYLGANMMFLQFIAGIWLAHWRLKSDLPTPRMGLIMALSGAGVFAILQATDIYDNLWRPILWGIPAFLIISGYIAIEAGGRLPSMPVLKYLGDASYSLYLGHVVTMQLLTHVLNSGRLSFVPIAIAASLAAGLAMHHLLERPLLALFRRRPAPLLPSQAT